MRTEFAVRLPLLALFSLSGFCGLIYESLWSHYIKLILGHAAYAQMIILATFMGGMAIGSWLVSKHLQRVRNPLMWYVSVELLVGVLGILFHPAFLATEHLLFDGLNGALLPLRWLICIALLLPPSILLGTTFPLMAGILVRHNPQSSGHAIGLLYFVNTIGAVAGALASGFVLLPGLGLPGTSLTVGLLNISIGLLILPYARRYRQPVAGTGTVTPALAPDPTAPALGSLAMLIAAITGMVCFIYEIVWIRMLSLVLGSSSHSFELMLGAFLLGLALGGFVIRKHADRIQSPMRVLAALLLLTGLAAVATLPLYLYNFSLMHQLMDALAQTSNGYVLFNLASSLLALLVMLPATLLAGMTLPLLTNIVVRSTGNEAVIGRIYAANTLGAIVGVFGAIYLFMPLLGVKGAIVFGAAINLLLGFALLFRFAAQPRLPLSTQLTLLGLVTLCCLLAITPFRPSVLASGVYRYGFAKLADNMAVLFYRDGRTASIAVTEDAHGMVSIITNGKVDAGLYRSEAAYTPDEDTMILAGAIPQILKPDLKTVANIGFGSGLTTHTLLASPSLEKVDNIEIEAAIVEGARHFGQTVSRAYLDARSHIHIDDAKAWLANTQEQYDVVVSEPSNPWVSGTASLFTLEFYDRIKRSLKPDGLLVQWLQLYEIDARSVASVMKALGERFNHYQIYNSNGGDLLIIASDNPIPVIPQSPLPATRLRQTLKTIGIESNDNIRARYLGSKATLAPFFQWVTSPANSDFQPYLTFRAPMNRFRRDNVYGLGQINSTTVPYINWLEQVPMADDVGTTDQSYPAYTHMMLARAILHFDTAAMEDLNTRFATSIVQNGLLKCQLRADENQGALIESLFEIGQHINQGLPEAQSGAFWQQLSQCDASQFNPVTRDWLDLLTAIATEDFSTISRLGSHLLEQEGYRGEKMQHYLMAATMAANLALGQSQASSALIEKLMAEETASELPIHLQILLQLTRTHSAISSPVPDAS